MFWYDIMIKIMSGDYPTCEHAGTEQRTCYTCHTQETQLIQPSGHAASEAVTENRTAPTCTEQGTYELATYCTVCSAELGREICTIAALGHAPATEWTVDVEPDCTNAGSKSHRCTRCDRATDHAEIPATGHDFGDWYQTATPTCTQDGTRKQDCTRCDYAESEQISATGHSYTQTLTPPTCTEQGYTTHTCHCSEHYTDSYTDALGHTESDWIVDSEPTVNQDGSRHTECTVCHTVLKTEALEAIPETTEQTTTAPDTETETETELKTETETETELKTETETETDPAGQIVESTAPEATEPDTETETQPEPDTAPNGCKSLLGGNLLFAILLPAILPLGKKRRG